MPIIIPHNIDRFESCFNMYAKIVTASGIPKLEVYREMMNNSLEQQNSGSNIDFVRENVENILHNPEQSE